ncbi:MAG: DedA family protein [Candidatus Cloacimonetes bacterium]|nr:DedA family protein [Candidatus Cloacimonadota bacterium]
MKLIRKLYDYTLSWAHRPMATWALFFLAFIESSFFIIPPDVLLIALCTGHPKKSFKFVLACLSGSVLGALFGYLIGALFFASVGQSILDLLHLNAAFLIVQEKYAQNAFFAIFAAAFTPIPFKVFTIAGGFCRVDLGVFVLASILGRGLRFSLVGGLIYIFGAKVEKLIDKHFNLFTIVFTVALFVGFAAIKYFGK